MLRACSSKAFFDAILAEVNVREQTLGFQNGIALSLERAGADAVDIPQVIPAGLDRLIRCCAR